MKKFNQTKKALLLSLLVLMVCFGMFLGTTYAWFTDSVSSAGNVIQTGNLDIEVQYTLDGEKDKEYRKANETRTDIERRGYSEGRTTSRNG